MVGEYIKDAKYFSVIIRFFEAGFERTDSKMMRFIALALCTIAAVHCATLAVTPDNEAQILQQDSDVNPDGSHFSIFETQNGIKVREEGTVKVHSEDNVVHSVKGEFSYNDGYGNPVVVSYVADENGYQPKGDHLPTPPPIPAAIARALEYIAAHPYVEDKKARIVA